MLTMSSYFIAVQTMQDYTVEEYAEVSQRMASLLEDVFGNSQILSQITNGAEYESCQVDIEVALEGEKRQLLGKAVLDFMGPYKVKLDKPKLSKILKARPEVELWPLLKVAKRLVPDHIAEEKTSAGEEVRCEVEASLAMSASTSE